MADFTQTVTNSFNLCGPAPSFWNDMEWGENWCDGSEDLSTQPGKLISESLSLVDAYGKAIKKALSAETLSVIEDQLSQRIGDGTGYWFEFTAPSDNAENRALTNWTEV